MPKVNELLPVATISIYCYTAGMPKPENTRDPQQNRPVTVDELLSSPDLNNVIRSYQENEGLSEDGIPLDVAFADLLMYVGTEQIRSAYASLSNGLAGDPELSAVLAESVTAVAFGLSYLALREFVTTSSPDQDGHHRFDNTRLLARLDDAVTDTALSRKTTFSSSQSQLSEAEVIETAEWNNMVEVARGFGFAALLNGRGWVKLPKAITQLIQGLNREKEVPQMVVKFQGTLMSIETMAERDERLKSIRPKVVEPENFMVTGTKPVPPVRRESPGGSQLVNIFQALSLDPILMGQIESL